MALTIAGPPVNWATSPVNSPGPRVVTVFGVSPDSSTISTSPDLTTKKLKSRSPSLEELLPVRVATELGQGAALQGAIWAASSLGKAAASTFACVMSQPPSGMPCHLDRAARRMETDNPG